MVGAEEPDCMWLGTDNGRISQACLSMTNTTTGSQPVVTLVMSLHQSIVQNTLNSGQASLPQRASISHESASTNPCASSSAKKHVPCPRSNNSSQGTASTIGQQQSGGTPVVGLEHTSKMDYSQLYDDQPTDTVEHGLGSTSAQPSPYSTAFARAVSQQQMRMQPSPRSMQSQAGSVKQSCRPAHDGPVHEILVLSDRVVTRGGREQSVVMKEWTLKGKLMETHSTCKQGQYIQYQMNLPCLLCCHAYTPCNPVCFAIYRGADITAKTWKTVSLAHYLLVSLYNKGQTHTPSSNQWYVPCLFTLPAVTLASLVSPGPITCMTALHQPSSQHKRANQAGQTLRPDMDRWQLITGHINGQVKVWAAAAEQALQPLAVMGAPTVSPVRSLVVLADQELLCFAHADGHLALHTAPKLDMCRTQAESENGQDLPVFLLQHADFQAHQQGLEQCVKCEVGLMSVGSSGTILMWSDDQLSNILEQPCFLADDG